MARLPSSSGSSGSSHHASHSCHTHTHTHSHSHSPPKSPPHLSSVLATTEQMQHRHLRFPSHILREPYLSPAAQHHRLRSRRRDALAPDFDVRETAAAFFLEGELPGVRDAGAVRLDWIDRRTLAVDARIEKVDLVAEWGVEVAAPGAAAAAAAAARRGSHGSGSSGYDGCEGEAEDMVVDEDATERKGGAGNGGVEMRKRCPGEVAYGEHSQGLLAREWLCERRLGHYQRTFTFPTDVDAAAIRARLGQGLLRVLVPKVVRKGVEAKQVAIECCE